MKQGQGLERVARHLENHAHDDKMHRDAFARSAYNRYYYACFLRVRYFFGEIKKKELIELIQNHEMDKVVEKISKMGKKELLKMIKKMKGEECIKKFEIMENKKLVETIKKMENKNLSKIIETIRGEELVGKIAHKDYPCYLKKQIKKKFKEEEKKIKGKRSSANADSVELFNAAICAADKISKIMTDARGVRNAADYHPEMTIVFSGATSSGVASEWYEKVDSSITKISRAWKNLP